MFDFYFIQSVIISLDRFYVKAIDYIKTELKNNPFQFGISEDKAFEVANLNAEDFPVEFSSVTFYDDGSWMIRFADADFPVISYGFGIIVFFEGVLATGMDIIGDDPEFLE